MSTPQQPQGDPGQPYIPQGYELAKKKKPFYQRLGCIIPLAIVLLLIVIIAVNTGGSDDSSNSSGSSSSNTDTGTGQDDSAAVEAEEKTEFQPGETYTGGKGLDVTLASFQATSSALGSELACGQVTYANNSDEQVSFSGAWDWKAQNPAGVITDPTFSGGDDLSSGELAPGGTVSGSVCFDGAAPGEYRITYSPTLSFSSDTATWVANL